MLFLSPPDFHALRINAQPLIYVCESEWNWAPTPLSDHDFWLVIAGRGTLEVDDQTHDVRAGNGFILRPGDAPRGVQDPHHRLTVFFAHFDVLDQQGEVAPPFPTTVMFTVRDISFFVTLAHRIERFWQRGDDPARHQAQLGLGVLLWQIWDEGAFPTSPANTAFEALASAIRREPGRAWTLDEMARHVHLSRAQFTRRFRELYGTSPTHFVIQTRLERAGQLLSETDMTLAQIARALGYTDAYFFSRQFRQFTGQTPGALRKRRGS